MRIIEEICMYAVRPKSQILVFRFSSSETILIKLSSSAEFMISFFYPKTLFPFLFHSYSPQDWQYQERVESEETPWRLPSTQYLCVTPHFVFVERSISLLGLTLTSKIRLRELLIREMRKCRNNGQVVKSGRMID